MVYISPGSLLRVAQHLVGLLDAVEEPSALLYVVLVLVGVVFEREPTVGFLQFRLRDVSGYAQYVVVAPGPTHVGHKRENLA